MQLCNVLITVQEVAQLEDIYYETIKKRIQRGKLKAEKVSASNPQGFEYRINLSDLSPQAQKRYYAQLKANTSDQLTLDDYMPKQQSYKGLTMLDLTEKQRKEAYFWEKPLRNGKGSYQNFISKKLKKRKSLLKLSTHKLLKNLYQSEAYGVNGNCYANIAL